MFRPLELFIGLRYTRSRRRSHFISFIALTSMLGITVGVWALITVLSVMNGFERELRDRILAVASHVTISARQGWLQGWPELVQVVSTEPQVTSAAPFIIGQGLLTRGAAVTGVLVRGVLLEHEAKVSSIMQHLRSGNWESLASDRWGMVLGSALAMKLGVTVGDKVTLIAPKGRITPAGLLPRLKRFTVTGIFGMNMYEYDSTLALIHMDDAAALLEAGSGVSGIRLRVKDIYHAPLVSAKLRQFLSGDLKVSDWTREHRNFFRALKIERRVMFIILLLIVAVAAFNIVSTLIMVVADKRSEVAILRTLGLPPLSVTAIFVVQGMIIGLAGTLLGSVLGVLTSVNIETLVPWLENLFGIEFFPASVYVINDFPGELRWLDVIHIATASFGISLVATLYPAWRAAQTQPVEALRYE